MHVCDFIGEGADAFVIAMKIMNRQIESELPKETPLEDNAENKLELWNVHLQHMLQLYSKGGNRRRVRNDPMLMDWAIVLLARTSVNTYNEIWKVMMLPHIPHLQIEKRLDF